MRLRLLFLLLCLLVAPFIHGQEYPMLIKPGETKSIVSTNEALFVLLKSQMKAYQDSVNELEFARKNISLLKTENSLQLEKEQIYIRDTVIYSNLYHHYYGLWDSTDKKLETAEIKLVKANHMKWNLGLTGMLIGVIATLLIAK